MNRWCTFMCRKALIVTMKRTVYLTCALFCVAGQLGCGGPGKSTPESAAAPPGATATTSSGTVETCALLTEADIAEAVGNPVKKGQPFSGSSDCKWDTDTQGDVTVLLIVYRTGSIREQALCPELRKQGKAAGFENVADGSTWKFESVAGLFNSGEFEACGPKGFISLQLNGKRDEATLRQATTALVGKILSRL